MPVARRRHVPTPKDVRTSQLLSTRHDSQGEARVLKEPALPSSDRPKKEKREKERERERERERFIFFQLNRTSIWIVSVWLGGVAYRDWSKKLSGFDRRCSLIVSRRGMVYRCSGYTDASSKQRQRERGEGWAPGECIDANWRVSRSIRLVECFLMLFDVTDHRGAAASLMEF